MPLPIQHSAAAIDLGPRIFRSASVVASPALAAETIIGSITCTGDIAVTTGVELTGWAAFLIGASGTTSTLRVRRTNASGTIIAASGALTTAAAALFAFNIQGFDTGPTMPGQVYVLTLQVANGAAESTVSAVYLRGLVV